MCGSCDRNSGGGSSDVSSVGGSSGGNSGGGSSGRAQVVDQVAGAHVVMNKVTGTQVVHHC